MKTMWIIATCRRDRRTTASGHLWFQFVSKSTLKNLRQSCVYKVRIIWINSTESRATELRPLWSRRSCTQNDCWDSINKIDTKITLWFSECRCTFPVRNIEWIARLQKQILNVLDLWHCLVVETIRDRLSVGPFDQYGEDVGKVFPVPSSKTIKRHTTDETLLISKWQTNQDL